MAPTLAARYCSASSTRADTLVPLVVRDRAGPHDIVRMMRQGAVFWTTSESHFYAEPKRLAELGYLSAEKLPRIQTEAAVKRLAAYFSDDQTILASLAGLRQKIEAGYQEIEGMKRRIPVFPTDRRWSASRMSH